jgi:serine/threonine protein kinase
MSARRSLHPTDRDLRDYSLGKLDDNATDSIQSHLDCCINCRERVAAMTSDSFLSRLREVQAGPESPLPRGAPLPAPVTLRSGTGGTSARPASLIPPDLANHSDYEILRELGRGGMGVVFLAHNKLMGRKEVLKVVNRELMDQRGVLDRFLREIRNAAQLHHPNIVTAYSAIRAGEILVFAMEYVEGYDLAQLVKGQGQLQVAHACNFIYQAAQGLQYAHQKGLVHRDIKPGNLILTREGKKPVVKVLDFGLAKATREGPMDQSLTHEGQMLGTPDYIAPEQSLDAQKADIRADIYSLGCTLYYLLKGAPPFQGNSLYEVLQAHHSTEAKPLNLVRPEVPWELASVVAKMMAKEPARRYGTPGEAGQALKPFFKPAEAPSVPAPDPTPSIRSSPERTRTVAQSVPARPAKQAAEVAESPEASKPLARTHTDPMWERLIDIPAVETLSAEAPPPRPSLPRTKPAWLWPVAAAGVLTLGLVLAWAAGVFRAKTKHGDEFDAEFDTEQPSTARPIPTSPAAPPELAGNPGPGPSKTASVRPDGFVRLFNGKDLAGWKTYPGQLGNWRVANGILVGSGPGAISHLYTTRDDFKDFHLRVEARINDVGNGGVDFRSSFGPSWPAGNPRYPLALEAQIYSKAGDRNYTGSLFAGNVVASVAVRPVLPFEWFTLEVIARGNHMVVKVNGMTTADYTDVSRTYSRGHIALQQLGAETIVEFRRIELRELPADQSSGVTVRANDFVSLFNRKDLTGWNVDSGRADAWRVQNGELLAIGPGDWRKLGFLLTERDYGEFRILRVTINDREVFRSDLGTLAEMPRAHPGLRRYSGRIGFQSATGTMRFRNIEIKELSEWNPSAEKAPVARSGRR